MSLYDILKNKNKHFVLEYFPITDMAYNLNLQSIFDAEDEIAQYFSEYKFILDIEHFKDYLVCFEMSKYNKDVKFIKEEYIDKFKYIMAYFNKVLKCYNKKDILSFVDANDIESQLNNNLSKVYYDLLKNNKKDISKNTFNRALNSMNYYFLYDIELWADLIIKHNLQNILLRDIDELVKLDLEKVLQFIKLLKDKSIYIQDYIKELNKIMDKCLESNGENALYYKAQYSTILSYYKLMKLPEANKYNELYSVIKDSENKWMEKNGQEIKTELQIDGIIESIKKIKHPGLQILYYTHENSRANDGRKFVSFYEAAKNISVENRPLRIDIFQTTQPKTEIYDNWLQDCYAMLEIIHLNILSYVYSDKELSARLFDGLQVFFNSIIDSFTEKKNLYIKFQDLINKQNKCIRDLNNNTLIQDYCKNTVNFIEQLLRELYYELHKGESYVDKESLTLGMLLNSNNNMFESKLKKDFLDGIRFYLSHDTNSKGEHVGLDLRNKMNHGLAMSNSDYNQTLFMRISLLFITLINELYITFTIEV